MYLLDEDELPHQIALSHKNRLAQSVKENHILVHHGFTNTQSR